MKKIEYTGQHEAIINLDIWRAVQNRSPEDARAIFPIVIRSLICSRSN